MTKGQRPTTHIYEDLTGHALEVAFDADCLAVRFNVGNATALLTMPQARSLARGIHEALNAWSQHVNTDADTSADNDDE